MATTYVKAKHDIGITNVGTAGAGTDIIGMMLAQNKGVPLYNELDTPLLADQFFTGAPDQTYIDPEQELPLGQSDYRTGFGLEYADPGDPLRYYSSIGADMRFRNQALAGPISTGIANIASSTTATIANGNMEAAGSWTGGAQSAVQAHGGSNSWRIIATAGNTIYQDATTWTNNWRGRAFTFTCWVYCADVGATINIQLNDGIGTTSSSVTSAASWVLLSVSRVLNASATRLRLILNVATGTGGDYGYWDDATIYSPVTGTCVKMKDFNSALYFAIGNTLQKLNGTGNGFTEVATLPVTITDLEVFSDSKLYIAQGLSNAYFEMNTSEVLTINNLANNTMKYLCFVHTTVDTMYGSDGVNTIRSTTNPAAGGTAWSGQTIVGSSYFSITKLIEKSGALYIMKSDIPYYLNSSGTVKNDLAPELATELTSTDNGKNSLVWLGNLYLHWGTQTLLENDAGINTIRSPALTMTNLADFNGYVMALAGDASYLYIIVDNGTKVEVLAGRTETIGSSTSWVWHPINETTLTGCETALISSVYQKRLWFTSTSSSDSLFYIPLPLAYGNITADTNRSFQTGSYFITPYYHGNFKLTQKAFIKIQATLGHAYDANKYWTVAYEKLGDSSWTTIGNLVGTATNRSPVLYIPVDGSSNKPISTMMRFKFTAVTDSSTSTPILSSFNVTSVLYPTRKTLISCKVRVSEEIVLKDGTIERNMYDTIVTTLDNAKNATWPISIRDVDGNTQTVKLLPLPRTMPRFEVVKDEKGREQERWYNLLMETIPLS